MNRILFAALVAVFAPPALADITAIAHVSSKHFDRREYNEVNPGLEVRWHKDSYFWSVGGYRNSNYRNSFYVGAGKELLAYGPVALNLRAGLITGYEWAVTPGLLPEVTFTFGNAVALVSILPRIKDSPTVLGFSFGYRSR